MSLKPKEQNRISKTSQEFHKKIFKAIKVGDNEKAKNNMLLHLESIEDFMKKNL